MGTVVDMMKKHGISQVPVVDDGKLHGVVSEVQVLDALVLGTATMKTPVSEFSNLESVATVQADTSIGVLTNHFAEDKVAVVLKSGKVDGLLTKIDLIEHMSHETRLLDAV